MTASFTTPAGGADPAALAVAVRASAARVALLLRSVRLPSAPALGDWDVTDLAVHVSHVLDGLTSLARGDGPLLDDLSELAALTTSLVEREEERDLGALADRIEASAAGFVEVVAETSAQPDRPWLVRGVDVPATTLAAHVLNELVVHGSDLARAAGVAWPVPGRHAALVLDGFIFPLLGHLGPAVVDQEAALGVSAAYDIRVRGGGRYVLRLTGGNLTVEAVSSAARPGPVDCHLSVEPAAFLLVTWGRRSQWSAIARGQMVVWGRRPWMGLKLRGLLTNP